MSSSAFSIRKAADTYSGALVKAKPTNPPITLSNQTPSPYKNPKKNIDDICDVFLEDAFLHENGQINVKQREKERKDLSFPCYDLLSRNGDGQSAFTRKISQCFDFDSQETHKDDKKSDTDQLSVAIEQEESEQLHPFQPEDFEAPELLFEMPDYSSLENKKHKRRKKEENTQPLQTEFDGYYVMQQIEKNKKQKEYDKNICRYVARTMVRCFVHNSYRNQVLLYCRDLVLQQGKQQVAQMAGISNQLTQEQLINQIYNGCIEYMYSQLEYITGHRALQVLLTFNGPQQYVEKFIFRQFAKWFLEERAFRYITSGNMRDKKSYIRYKNQIMLRYINKPEKWTTNVIKQKK